MNSTLTKETRQTLAQVGDKGDAVLALHILLPMSRNDRMLAPPQTEVGRADRAGMKQEEPNPEKTRILMKQIAREAGQSRFSRRIVDRPDPAQWGTDELLTLPEAASLFWPSGPLTTASLRNAIRKGRLAYVEIAGKFLTTKTALAEMSVCRKTGPEVDVSPVEEDGTMKDIAATTLQKAVLGKVSRARRSRRSFVV